MIIWHQKEKDLLLLKERTAELVCKIEVEKINLKFYSASKFRCSHGDKFAHESLWGTNNSTGKPGNSSIPNFQNFPYSRTTRSGLSVQITHGERKTKNTHGLASSTKTKGTNWYELKPCFRNGTSANGIFVLPRENVPLKIAQYIKQRENWLPF